MDKHKMKFELSVKALECWDRSIQAKKSDKSGHEIDIFSTIGDYGDGTGITLEAVKAKLKAADGESVTVNINSGGGDFFEGIAINTLLSEYSGDVNVKILGLAASAASIVALAGDTISIGEGALMMIHNAWTMAIGNKTDMAEASAMLAKFDESMTDIYTVKTGLPREKVISMMHDETWLTGKEAVDMKFASGFLGADEIVIDKNTVAHNNAVKKIDVTLAKAGIPRSERRSLIKEISSKPRAAENVMPCADNVLKEKLTSILNTLKKE